MRSSDLALAQITAKWRGSLQTFQAYQADCTKIGFELDLGIYLRNLVAHTTGQSRFLTVGGLKLAQLQNGWDDGCQGLDFALNLLRSNTGISSPALLASPFLLISLGFYGAQRSYSLSPEEAAGLVRWVLLTNAKGRYSRGSSDSLLDQDLKTIREGGSYIELLDRLRTQVGRLDIAPEELEGRSQRSALFKTMFLAFQADGAKDWQTQLAIALSHVGSAQSSSITSSPRPCSKKAVTAPGRSMTSPTSPSSVAAPTAASATEPSGAIPALMATSGEQPFTSQCIPTAPGLLTPDRYREFLTLRRQEIAKRLNTFLA